MNTKKRTCHFSQITYTYLEMEQMNKHLRYVKNYCGIIEGKYSPYDKSKHNMLTAYLYLTDVTIYLSYRKASKWINVAHRMDIIKQVNKYKIDGSIAYCNLQRYAHILDLRGKYGYTELDNGKITWDIASLGGIRYWNEKYNNTRHDNCYGYDLNSAFAFACLNKIPNTEKCYYLSKVKKNQIGFDIDGIPHYYKEDNLIHKYVFDLMDNKGLQRWAEINYKRRNKNKEKYKQILNLAIGQMQHHNPFVRNVIIDNSNRFIKSKIDDNTLMSNTDSIISMVERKDLTIGHKLGQWKLQNKGSFAYNTTTYQWNKSIPTYSGIPKGWFREGYDLLIDTLPTMLYNYRKFDKEKMEIKINEKIESKKED